MFLVDSHCHLHLLNYENIHKNVSDVLDKSHQKGVQLVLSVSTGLLDYEKMVQFIGYRNDVVFSCGIHPLYVHEIDDASYNRLYDFSSQKNVVAVGETGLDYFHQSENKKQQQQSFQEHIRVAKRVCKPIIVHSRCASKDSIMLLQEENIEECGGVLHCFNDSIDVAKLLLNLNFYISFSGMITFRKIWDFQKIIKYIPIDRVLLETDSPYLTPVPYRGIENQPAYIYEIAEYVALVKNISIKQLAHITTSNFFTLFNLKKEKYV